MYSWLWLTGAIAVGLLTSPAIAGEETRGPTADRDLMSNASRSSLSPLWRVEVNPDGIVGCVAADDVALALNGRLPDARVVVSEHGGGSEQKVAGTTTVLVQGSTRRPTADIYVRDGQGITLGRRAVGAQGGGCTGLTSRIVVALAVLIQFYTVDDTIDNNKADVPPQVEVGPGAPVATKTLVSGRRQSHLLFFLQTGVVASSAMPGSGPGAAFGVAWRSDLTFWGARCLWL